MSPPAELVRRVLVAAAVLATIVTMAFATRPSSADTVRTDTTSFARD